ncbi:MAG TPA: alpha/beta hydrolase [Candidatus Saccharimonadales bacterium]|nr:alpha/beta hydrolase [Candidatus Saccharimonadales bacterium]
MPRMRVNDISMYYEIHGRGEPIVLIPGLGVDVSQYTQIIELLSSKHKVIAIDNRGAGRTDKPHIKYSIGLMAADVASLLTKLRVKKANILGTSMGGRIAASLALDNPKLVRRLILVSTSMRATKPLSWPIRLLAFVFRLPIINNIKRYPQPYYAFELQRKASRSYDCTARLREMRVPTLILHARDDKIADYLLAKETHAGIKNSKIVAFTGGHMFFLLKPTELANAVSQFLSEK